MTADTARAGWLRRHGALLLGGPGRVTGVDLARGIAVLGMFTAHVGVTTADLGTLPGWLSLAHGRSSILFALVAGVSLALVTGGPRPLAGDALVRARTRLLVRSVLLLAVVALLDLLDTPVLLILGFYACYFVLALPFLRWPARRLAVAAAVVAVVGPPLALWGPTVLARAGLRLPQDGSGAVTDFVLTGAYPAVVWMAYVFAGMAVGRCDLRSDNLRTGLVAGGLGAAAVCGIVSGVLVDGAGGQRALEAQADAASVTPGAWSAPWPPPAYLVLSGPHHDTTLEAVGSGGFALAVLGLCLYAGRVGARVLAPLAAVGAAALTVYSLHIVAIWRWDLVGSETNRPLAVMVVVTLVAATAWRFLLGRGPLERLLAWVATRAAPAGPRDAAPQRP
ncbi:heparan-alpha-glucosaminide N-acetyltransferase domain-containing protein [Puerhibacterium puerhi]|uniref:heparan-alpha-glucosaminide N-acetyltransferase domain-containing protein n=1 Tax=Puerhibacterium puerhi TaxID=2692623 RepID=UPI00135A9F9C|nr:heparan-alpha-glucosaminide N-acetyltransferase domain-containing protein [Puerhibacterium puerhi]